MTLSGWTVELHGTLRCGLWKSIDRELDKVKDAIIYGGKVRTWMNNQTQVFLPDADEDVVFVFSHFLQHFYKEGIGLRQICDWCRLIWKYRGKINLKLLENRLHNMGVMSEWHAFSLLTVEYLGMPHEIIPLFDGDNKWKRKANKICEFIIEVGNFGHNRDYSFYQKYPYIVYKAISMWRHIKDFGRYFTIFPRNAVKVTSRRMRIGFSVAIRGGKHE